MNSGRVPVKTLRRISSDFVGKPKKTLENQKKTSDFVGFRRIVFLWVLGQISTFLFFCPKFSK